MAQLHKRFTDSKVKDLPRRYLTGEKSTPIVFYDTIRLTTIFKIISVIILGRAELFICIRKSVTENKSIV